MAAKVEFLIPLLGKNENWAASKQPKLTSPDLENVRVYGVLDNRARLGQRPGLDKRYSARLGGDSGQPVVAICQVTTVER